ncbi:homoprotocatechuate degradation operon regulator HpaR [Alcaligenes endophyticus]|uniref:Homoprotocatechuate degradation operon regulator HpaR n=1 Tax=Alcaligenes endophyticus TaxID=1929088 RepID=A0ABT8EM79_9BURK|nr:homoprotocatechuate degradation operon regulator HpaR [Alcaligenes endophyticus]MCX5591015.1 homoprotocatechuate degradation operon regulator HpaR [Alcaligenes endophyticus]MDN4122408.1 homoprotocatechuate degradation operon regulator HpaR [Alcaligenes endophyticus]
MSPKLAQANLPQLLLKARESIFRHFRPIITHFGLTEQQWRILRTLGEHEQLEPRELCDMCQILSSSMAGVLARMEAKELIQRAKVPNDQRRVFISTAPKGEELIAQIAPLIEAQYRYLEERLGKALVSQTYTTLESLIEREKNSIVQAVELPGEAAKQPTGD